MDEHGSVIADWLHSLAAYSNSVEVLQTQCLMQRAHRDESQVIWHEPAVWEESGSNNALVCINKRSFIFLLYDCVVLHL